VNFTPSLAQAVLDGRKTVTRRLVSPNPRSPWASGACRLKVGKTYAVCPGRGKHAVARVEITAVRRAPLGHLTRDEARREGFESAADFEQAWAAINGGYDPTALVWRVGFRLAA
jgi:hypothetical protein